MACRQVTVDDHLKPHTHGGAPYPRRPSNSRAPKPLHRVPPRPLAGDDHGLADHVGGTLAAAGRRM